MLVLEEETDPESAECKPVRSETVLSPVSPPSSASPTLHDGVCVNLSMLVYKASAKLFHTHKLINAPIPV